MENFIKEYDIGQTFEWKGETYMCIEGIACTNCAFFNKDTGRCKLNDYDDWFICSPKYRKDKKSVIFVKVEKDSVGHLGADKDTTPIPNDLYRRLCQLGIIPNEVRSGNVGASDYSMHIIQPWAIWQEYGLNPWDADIVKRVLRHKTTDPRRMDYKKIIHICEERIRQIDEETAE